MKQFHKRSEDKCLIKIKKYTALFLVYELSPCLLREYLRLQKGLKQEKYFTIKTKTCALCPSMEAMFMYWAESIVLKWLNVYMSGLV